MSDLPKKVGFKWLDKLKKVKHIEIYVSVIFVAILLLIYMSSYSKKSSKKVADTGNEMMVTEYVDKLESDLEEILNGIGGVTNVKILITLDMGQADVTDSEINLNAFPPIKGVLVTAKGLNNTTTRMKVLHAIETVINISDGNIEILSRD
ncbi:MAG: hypothetical protein E7374_02770 [Clostridiales bacterium]|nr:hypothetical protein [Clostridiales bacterium]